MLGKQRALCFAAEVLDIAAPPIGLSQFEIFVRLPAFKATALTRKSKKAGIATIAEINSISWLLDCRRYIAVRI
jgi:hypothetical protein